MARPVPSSTMDFENIFVLRRPDRFFGGGACVVRLRGNEELFLVKTLIHSDSTEVFDLHKAEYDFMRTFCTDSTQRFLVHLFACFQNLVSAHVLT